MKPVSVLLCALALCAGASASPYPAARVTKLAEVKQRDFEHKPNKLTSSQRQLAPQASPLDSLSSFASVLEGVFSVGQALMTAFGAEGAGEDMARALEETDPIDILLNTIELDTEACRQRLACEMRTGASSFAYGDMAYNLLSNTMPSLKKYGRHTARQLGVASCSEAFTCRYSDSPLMGTARSMRGLADGVCDMHGDSFASMMCRGFAFIVDSLESI